MSHRALLDAFLSDPRQAVLCFDLCERERDALATIPAPLLRRFADSLVTKRWSELRAVVPWALRVCPSLESRYRVWLGDNPAPVYDTVLDPGLAEALRALPYLSNAMARDELEVTYAPDIFRWEVLRACSRRDGCTRELRSRFCVHELVGELEKGILPMDPETVNTSYRFERARFFHKIHP